MDAFYLPPGPRLEPGDIFVNVPFPSLRYPLEFFRPNIKKPETADIFKESICSPKDSDTARGTFQKRTVILLSHGCELDGVERDVKDNRTQYSRRYWLAAPVMKVSDCTSDKMKERMREGTQPNKFYLPADESMANEEHFVELRKITPINAPFFLEGKKIRSLTNPATIALQAHIGLFFSGLILHVQTIQCPVCRTTIDPSAFRISSSDETDID
jgi:hypothetical protein